LKILNGFQVEKNKDNLTTFGAGSLACPIAAGNRK
jgi:hypothetical protein